MAVMIPPVLGQTTESPGEREIFLRLKDDPSTKEWIVLHSLDIANHSKQIVGELDFVVIIPKLGVICLEIKAHTKLKRVNGMWYFGNHKNGDSRGPFKQAADGMYSLRTKLFKKHPALTNVVFWTAVIFPYLEFEESLETPFEWHNWQVIDSLKFRRQSIGNLMESVLINARKHLLTCSSAFWFRNNLDNPTKEQCSLIMNALRPDFEFVEKPKQYITRNNNEIRRFTEEQFVALDTMEENKRVVFQGPAGTGKTFLAIEAARRSSEKGNRVLLLCFNRFLGEWLKHQTATLNSSVTTSTLHSYMIELTGIRPEKDISADFWKTTLPSKAIESLLEYASSEHIYDEIIIDEAQDIMFDPYVDVLDLSLKGGLSAGRWVFFGDFEKQSIYGRNSHYSLEEFIKKRNIYPALYGLRINCRNTPRIAALVQLLGGLNPSYKRVLREDDGIEPEIKYYENEEEQVEILIDTLNILYIEGYHGSDIVILSPYSKKMCAERVAIAPWKDRLKLFGQVEGGFVNYCTIQSFKGMESHVIIITDINLYSLETEHLSLFYTGITRAVYKLIILVNNSVKQNFVDAIFKRPL